MPPRWPATGSPTCAGGWSPGSTARTGCGRWRSLGPIVAAPLPGTARTLEDIDVVGLGWGFVPQAELLLQTGAATRLDVDGSLVGVVDTDQAASVPGLFLAGEITGVTGAGGAVAEGASRAPRRGAARRLARAVPPRPRRSRPPPALRPRHAPRPSGAGGLGRRGRGGHRGAAARRSPSTRSAPREELHARDPRSLKGVTRAGMGMCQGRICGAAMLCLGSDESTRHDAARAAARRPLALPLTVGALAETPDHHPRREDHP